MSDTFKVDIIDYQNIKKVSMELDKGLTVIIGRTNEGKSSIMRAIHDAIFNSGADEDVRAGQKHYLVRLDNGKGNLVYKRINYGKNLKSAYQINGGEVLKKIGRSQIDEVIDLLNITEVRMKNNNKEKINFWFQEEKPFLTNATDTQLFEFLSLTSSEQYIKVLRQIKKDSLEVNTDISSTASAIDALKDLNESYAEFIENNRGYDKLYEDIVVFGDNVRKFNVVEGILEGISLKNNKLSDKEFLLKEAEDLYERLDFDRVEADYSSFLENYREEVELEKLISVIGNKNRRLREKEPLLLQFKGIYDGIDFDRLDGDYNSFLDDVGEFNILHKDLSVLKNKQDSLINRDIELVRIKIYHDSINIDTCGDDIRIIEEMSKELLSLEDGLVRVKGLDVRLKSKESDYSNAVSDYEFIVQEVVELEDELGYCPLCGSDFSTKDKGEEKHEC